MKILLFLLVVGATVYLLLLGLLFFGQTSILFPGAGTAPPLLPGSERLTMSVMSGDQLHGVHISPEQAGQSDAPVILGFGGNAWNAEAVALTLHDLYPGSDVVAFHYRGYPPSGGRPGAGALLEDAPLVLDHVAVRFPAKRIVAVGFSVGAAAAARLSTDRRLAGAILVTPFESIRKVAQSHYPWIPVGMLLRHRLEPAEDVARAKVPVAVIAADRDAIVPTRSTRALVEVSPTLVFDRTLAGCDHNSIYQHAAFPDAMREALRRIVKSD